MSDTTLGAIAGISTLIVLVSLYGKWILDKLDDIYIKLDDIHEEMLPNDETDS